MKLSIINNNEIYLNYLITDISYEMNIPHIDENYELFIGTNNNLKRLTSDNIKKMFNENKRKYILYINDIKINKESETFLFNNIFYNLGNFYDSSLNFYFNENIFKNNFLNFTIFSDIGNFNNKAKKYNFENKLSSIINDSNFLNHFHLIDDLSYKINLLSDKNLEKISVPDLSLIDTSLYNVNFPQFDYKIQENLFKLILTPDNIYSPQLNNINLGEIKINEIQFNVNEINDLKISSFNDIRFPEIFDLNFSLEIKIPEFNEILINNIKDFQINKPSFIGINFDEINFKNFNEFEFMEVNSFNFDIIDLNIFNKITFNEIKFNEINKPIIINCFNDIKIPSLNDIEINEDYIDEIIIPKPQDNFKTIVIPEINSPLNNENFKEIEFRNVNIPVISVNFKDIEFKEINKPIIIDNFKDIEFNEITIPVISSEFKAIEFKNINVPIISANFKDIEFKEINKPIIIDNFKDIEFNELDYSLIDSINLDLGFVPFIDLPKINDFIIYDLVLPKLNDISIITISKIPEFKFLSLNSLNDSNFLDYDLFSISANFKDIEFKDINVPIISANFKDIEFKDINVPIISSEFKDIEYKDLVIPTISTKINDISIPTIEEIDLSEIKFKSPKIELDTTNKISADFKIDLNFDYDLDVNISKISSSINNFNTEFYVKFECYDPTNDEGLSGCEVKLNDKIDGFTFNESLDKTFYGGPLYLINKHVLKDELKNYKNIKLNINKDEYNSYVGNHNVKHFLSGISNPMITNLGAIPLMPIEKNAYFTLSYGKKTTPDFYTLGEWSDNDQQYKKCPSDLDIHLYVFNDKKLFEEHIFYGNKGNESPLLSLDSDDHDIVDAEDINNSFITGYGIKSETITIKKFLKGYYYICSLHHYSYYGIFDDFDNTGHNLDNPELGVFPSSANIKFKVGTLYENKILDVSCSDKTSTSLWFDMCLIYVEEKFDENGEPYLYPNIYIINEQPKNRSNSPNYNFTTEIYNEETNEYESIDESQELLDNYIEKFKILF